MRVLLLALVCFVGAPARGGVLTDADDLEASVKAAMLEQAGESVLLLDASKIAARGRQAVASIESVSLVIADGLSTGDADHLRSLGATIRTTGERLIRTSQC